MTEFNENGYYPSACKEKRKDLYWWVVVVMIPEQEICENGLEGTWKKNGTRPQGFWRREGENYKQVHSQVSL